MLNFGEVAQLVPTIGKIKNGAEDGIRTRDLLLGKEMLYQLSHFRPFISTQTFWLT